MLTALGMLLALASAPEPTPASPRAVVLAMFQAFNRHDAAAMASLYADDARLTSSEFCHPRGKRDVVRTYQALFDQFPDIVDEVSTLVAEGHTVAVRFTARSHANGRKLDAAMMSFIQVRNGLIYADDTVFDPRGQPCSP